MKNITIVFVLFLSLFLSVVPVSPSVSYAAENCFNFAKDLKLGDTGEDVTKLQEFLLTQGFYVPVSGVYNAFTQRAVKNFQLKYKEAILDPSNLILPTGSVGGVTRDQINSLTGCPAVKVVAVEKVQTRITDYQIKVAESKPVVDPFANLYQQLLDLQSKIPGLSPSDPAPVDTTIVTTSGGSSGGSRGGGGGGSKIPPATTPPPTTTAQAPTVSMKVNNVSNSISVTSGATLNFAWTSVDANTCTLGSNPEISSFVGSAVITGTKTLTGITDSRTYTITCTGAGGTRSSSVVVTVQNSNPPVPTVEYTINAEASTGGTIVPSGVVMVPSGTNKTFAITPSAGYKIEDVKVNNVSVGAVSSHVFSKVAANATIKATFSQLPNTPPVNPGGGILPHFSIPHHIDKKPERIPDFAAYPTKTALSSGNWSNPSTWGGTLPGAGDIVLIPKNMLVILDTDAKVKVLGVKGSFSTDPNKSLTFTVGTLFGYDESNITIKPSSNVNQKVVFSGTINTVEDPAQFGVGMLTLGGNVEVQGRSISKPFSLLASPVSAGASSITLKDSVDWKVGDEVVLGGYKLSDSVTTQYVDLSQVQNERKIIASISGTNITFTSPLAYPHKNSVGNITRNLTFISDSSGSSQNGHIMFTGNTRVSFKGARLENLGRTRSGNIQSIVWNSDGTASRVGNNQIGRYTIHAHHSPYPIEFSQNVSVGKDPGLRWNFVIHGSYGSINNNIALNPGEAGVVAETFYETGEIRSNLVIGFNGGTKLEDDRTMGGGHGIWSRSVTIDIRDNVIDGLIKSHGYFYEIDLLVGAFISGFTGTYPNISGMPDKFKGKSYKEALANHQFLVFDGNKNFSNAKLWMGRIPNFVKISNYYSSPAGIVIGYSLNSTMENVVLDAASETSLPVIRRGYSRQFSEQDIMKNVKITGYLRGMNAAGVTTYIKDSEFSNKEEDILISRGDADCDCQFYIVGKVVRLENIKFGSGSQKHILANYYSKENVEDQLKSIFESNDIERARQNLSQMLTPTRIMVKNYNGTGEDFNVYYKQAAADWSWPVLGVTNQELFEGKSTHPVAKGVFGRSFADALIKDKVEKPNIEGYIVKQDIPSTWAVNFYQQSSANREPGSQLSYFPGGMLDYNKLALHGDKSDSIIGGTKKTLKLPSKFYDGMNKYIIHNPNKYTVMLTGKGKNLSPVEHDGIICEDQKATCPDGTTVSRDPNLMCDFSCAGAQPISTNSNNSDASNSSNEENSFAANVLKSIQNFFGVLIKN